MNRVLLVFLALTMVSTNAEEKDFLSSEEDWKLDLKSGNLVTSLVHIAVFADDQVEDLIEGFEAPKGNAVMGVKVWATNIDKPPYMIRSLGDQIGFNVTGEIQIYETEPEQPPRETPYG